MININKIIWLKCNNKNTQFKYLQFYWVAQLKIQCPPKVLTFPHLKQTFYWNTEWKTTTKWYETVKYRRKCISNKLKRTLCKIIQPESIPFAAIKAASFGVGLNSSLLFPLSTFPFHCCWKTEKQFLDLATDSRFSSALRLGRFNTWTCFDLNHPTLGLGLLSCLEVNLQHRPMYLKDLKHVFLQDCPALTSIFPSTVIIFTVPVKRSIPRTGCCKTHFFPHLLFCI